MIKKIIFIFFISFLLITIVGCKENKDNKATDNQIDEKEEINQNEKENEETKKEIGSLYIRYNQNNDKDAITDKINDLNNYVLITPKKEGYEFDGWFSDEDLNFIFKLSDLSMPTDENDIIIDVYADWSIQKFTVDFMDDGKLILSRTVAYGSSAREPRDTFKSGYRFIGWDKDFSCVTSDMVVNAIYEENNGSKNIMVVLGNWMNNDGTISQTMRTRLELALKAFKEFSFDYIVVSGGMANSQAGISEAEAMYNYLVEHGIDKNIIIKEDQSMSTQQNAIYTMQKLENIDFNNIVVVSTIEHFTNYQTIKFFNDAANNNAKIKAKNINIMIYTNNG